MHARLQSVKRGRYESTTGRRFVKSAVGWSEVSVKIFRGNHTLCSEGHVMHARLQSCQEGVLREGHRREAEPEHDDHSRGDNCGEQSYRAERCCEGEPAERCCREESC